MISPNRLAAQDLINPPGGGGFQGGSTFANNHWFVSNGTATNKWIIGSLPAGFSGQSAYITNSSGPIFNWEYTSTDISVVHFWRYVTFPAGVPNFTLTFNWAAAGEQANLFAGTNRDELLVSLAPSYYTPMASTTSLGTGVLPEPVINLARLQGQATAQSRTINIPGSTVGNCAGPVTMLLLFTWKNDDSGGTNPPAAVDNITLNGVPMTVNDPADRCADAPDMIFNALPLPGGGNTGTFVAYPATPALTNNGGGQATLDVSAAAPGTYTVEYQYTVGDCEYTVSTQVEIFPLVVARLKPTLLDCYAPGSNVNLSVMFDGANTAGGTWTISPAATLAADGTLTIPAGGGCYDVTYNVDSVNIHNCAGGPYTSTKKLLITIKPNAAFSISGATSPVCSAGDSVMVTLTKLSNGSNPVLTIDGVPASFETIKLAAPTTTGSRSYTICLKETNNAPANCDILPGANYIPCQDSVCQTFVVYNDGIGCGSMAAFPSECTSDPDMFDACPIAVINELQFSCKFFSLPGIQIIEAKLDVEPGSEVIFCSTDSICAHWVGSLPGELGNLITGGPTLSELGGAGTEAICYIINYEFCIPIPFVSDPCFDPIPLPAFIEDACDQTIGEFIFNALSELLGGDGGGGLVVADTDGDGAFDVVLEDYDGFPMAGDVCLANNIDKAQGTITLRHVTGWPFKPASACGVVTAFSINLLDLLPIGAIPILGGPIEDILATAGCGIELVYADEKTVEIPVINNTPPTFANCNGTGYVFSEGLVCNTAVNWSIPVAYDGCNGGTLPYRGRTAFTDASHYNGTPAAVVTVDSSGIYQTAGPVIGSELQPGTYSVTYTAYSCAGISSTCTFPVVVTSGNPVLACPANITVNTDVDECEAVVTGLTPRQGIGCATIINYNVDYPAGSGFADVDLTTPYSLANGGTHHDVSGLTFPRGTTTVTYTLLVDINGDGDVTDLNETQTCNFTITVTDDQKPVAACTDLEVKLDNTGNIVVFAVNQGNGTPFVNGGSSDNCDPNPTIEIAKAGGTYSPYLTYNCAETGDNFVNLRVTDADGNVRTCLADIKVNDFFEGLQMVLDAPEICLEANNPVQLNFSNYLVITLPNGQVLSHAGVAGNAYLGDAVGAFGITSFAPHPGSPSTDPGSITADGVYTPGTGTGFVTISYGLALPGAFVPQNGNMALSGCFEMVHATFELRQPLTMGSPECLCFDGEERIVDLGVITGGLEPYRIQYSGTRLDVDGDGMADDSDGQYIYNAASGHNINDFMQDLGELRVVYTQPTWSFTIVDARGCELFRSGSCDNDDFTEGPVIPCTRPAVNLTTEPLRCESQFSWQHPLPTDNCAVVLYDYRIINPDGTIDGPHNLDALLNIAPGAPIGGLFEAEYEFQLGTSVVYYYAEDAQGNFTTCTFTVNVTDNDPPIFINCPYPDVVQDAEPDFCAAYVNFALPLATDNCDIPLVTQIDLTGFHTGDRFPVGLTVLYYEAVDLAGNKDTCRVKVIVNDLRVPAITCPGDVVKNNDPWLCSAVVNNLAPVVAGPCKNNFGITYSVFADAALTQRKGCGVGDASGDVFDKGMSWVRYTVHSQPLLLISEVQQSGPVDRIEITNLGPAALDITCLMVTRTSSNPAANQSIAPVDMLPSLAGTIVPVGGVFVFNFAFNGPANLPACYKIAFKGNLIDEVAVNGFAGCGNFTGTLNSGDVARTCEDDSDTADDWVAAINCAPLSIGIQNADLEVMPNNGTTTSLQSMVEKTKSCTFKINVNDVEDPFCGKLDGITTYVGLGITGINANACNRSTITVPAGCIIGDVVFNLTGTATPANSKITLISPYGTRVLITELPADTLPAFFAQKSTGVWTLDIVPNIGFTPAVLGWSLKITCIDTFDLADQVLNNDLGVCGANFTWKHPYFVDNCFDGTISVAYTTTNAGCVPAGGLLLGKGGYVTTKFFCVGKTKVTYTLVDAAGNTETCGFFVTVKDAGKPVVICPQDIFINLSGGECGAFVNYPPTFTSDNCAVVDTVMVPPSGSWFPIGDSIVRITVYDAAGNSATCTFIVHIIEYVPLSNVLVCDDLTNVSLDSTCVYVVSADAALEGTDYHCYADYIITIKNNLGQIIGNSFHASNIGKTYVVTVLDPETGNSCWSYMKIEDKLAPKLTCPPNLTIACSEDTEPPHTGNVAATDCSSFTKSFDDQFTDFGECANPRARIKRTFIVTDIWGNQSTCSHTITVKAYDPAALVFPPNITVNCEAAYLNPAATAPQNTGIPSINGAPIGAGGLCATSIGHWDERLEICAGSYEIYRTWKVGNTCLPPSATNPLEYVQRIRVKDFAGPAFVCPSAVTVSTDSYGCCATAALPDMIISEGCSQIVDLEAKVTGTNPANGNIISFTVAGHLGDFPANNYWQPDTLAIFPYTQCLPVGTYNVRYTAADQCTNISECNFVLTVADLVPPAVSCQQFTTVAVGGNGMAIFDAAVFDAGTYDNCCLQSLQAGRMQGGSCSNTQVGATVKFCCADIGTTPLQVVFRATDCAGNTNDCMVLVEVQDKLKPSCQAPADVTVACENFDPTLLTYGKAAVADNCCLDITKNYQGQNGLTHTVSYTLFDTVCNRGTIVRTFRAFDCHNQSSSCTQRVVVNYTQDYFVKFPADVIITVCDGTGNYGTPAFQGKDCELLGTSFEDQIFTVVPDACFKIERTWTVINWCTYNPNEGCVAVPNPNPNPTVNHPANLPGPVISAPGTLSPWNPTIVKIDPLDPLATNYSVFYTGGSYKTTVNNVLTTITVPTVNAMNCFRYKQIIKIIDTQDPVFDHCPDTLLNVCDVTPNDPLFWNESYYYDAVTGQHDLCEAPAPLTVTATDSCAPTGITFHYLLFLDLNNDGTMETVVNSNNPPPANTVFFGNALNANYTGGTAYNFDGRPVPANQKYRFTLQTITNATSKTAKLVWNTDQSPGTFVTPELPYGTHKIKWFVEDGCGNEAVCEYTFVVKDCKAPTVVCLNGLSVNIMPTQMIQLWATDFLQYAEDNCTPVGQLKYGVRRSGTGTGFPLDGNGNPITNVIFTCADLGTQPVELWAIDAAGNADYCATYVIVQDNNGNCPSNGQTATVAGALKTETGTGLEEATVQLDISSPTVPPLTLYDLTDQSGTYGFTNAAPLISDLTVTPTKDNNPLNGVSTYDLVLISRHILGLEPLGSPYKMIAADANKSGSITTFDIVELRKLILGIYQELPNNTSWRFVDKAFAFPNVNNPFQTVFPENISISSIPASNYSTHFTAVKIGDVNQNAIANTLQSTEDRTTGTLLIDVEDRSVKAGENFEITFKTAEAAQGYQFTLNLKGLKVTRVDDNGQVDARNFGVFSDALTVSVDGAREFTVTFKAAKAGKISEMLSVSSRITKAEAYTVSGDRQEVALRFSSPTGMTINRVGFELYQNQPNPFVGKTFIGFHLPAAAAATLTVYDESGRVVFTQQGDFAKGYNSIAVDAGLVIPQRSGLLYYKLETATDMATKKMIQTK